MSEHLPRDTREKSILVVAPRLDIGGTEKHLARIIPLLRERGLEISIYVIERGGVLETELERARVPLHGLYSRKPKSLATLRVLFHLIAHLRRHRPDYLHFFLPRPYLIGSLSAELVGHRQRIMSRRSLADYRHKHPLLMWFEYFFHGRTCALIGNSTAVTRELVEECRNPSKVGLIHNGIAIDAPISSEAKVAARIKLELPAEAFVIVKVANFLAYKGHADLLNSLGRIKNQLPLDWRLLLVGRDEGVQRDLVDLAAKNGISDNIIWLGEQQNVVPIIGASDVAVLASHQEGFSNSLIETMGRGIPTIATAVGGNLDAIEDGVSGLLVPVASPEGLGEAIHRLSGDPSLRQRLGKNGRERVIARFSIESCAQRYENLYRGLSRADVGPLQDLIEAKSMATQT